VDWEDWLRTAARAPSDNEDAKRETTEDEIRDALDEYEALDGRPYRVYTKGSYANNTNVRLDYDVDIAVEYHGFFYFDFVLDAADYGPDDARITTPTSDPYTRADFKRDVRAALEAKFGKSAVTAGDIAYRVREKKTTLPADVVPCWEYRRYDTVVNGNLYYNEGSRVFPSSGGHKDNFPKLQVSRGTTKNNNTGYRYKRMVRALKKLQTKLVDDGLLDSELASYFTECLVFNVPNDNFNHSTYLADMRAVLASIFNATLDKGDYADWEHVHGLQYLFHGEFKRSAVHHMADVAWDAMGFE
jgi:hypothetical protein